ncbi:MAG: AAA family ATPase [Flexilinea sp.]|nr:AAA family ATPase [Flexilinea sp.]
MKLNHSNIPQELKLIPNWVVWRSKPPKKLPYNPETGEPATANNPSTWGTYDSALNAYDTGIYDGIGFELGTDEMLSGYTVVDLDHVLINWQLSTENDEIVHSLDSYTEISQSGEGLHIFVRGQKPGNKCRNDHIEIYDRDRFIAMTGNLYGNRPDIMTRTASLADLYEREFGPDDLFEPPEYMPQIYTDDSSVLQKARNSKNGMLFSNLYDHGDIRAYSGDNSRADLALCNILAYWTNCEEAQIDRLFRGSALYRGKWDSKRGNCTYGQMTISKAIAGIKTSVNNTPVTSYEWISAPEPRAESVAAYQQEFEKKLTEIRDQPKILTGFSQFDQMMGNGLLPEIIILGGQTGTGKTGFALQIADYIAAAGQDVLYFALEMSRFELISKSISRISYMNDSANAFTARDVMFSKVDGNLTDKQIENLQISCRKYFSEIGPNMFIHDVAEPVSINAINGIVESHINQHGEPALIIIDYLQLLAQADYKFSDKQNVDNIMHGMKRINLSYGLPVLAISSLNRQSYTDKNNNNSAQKNSVKNEVQLSGLKESGSIEYSSGIVLGLNRESYSELSNNWKMNIKLLKGRFIESNEKSQNFIFHPANSYFSEVDLRK